MALFCREFLKSIALIQKKEGLNNFQPVATGFIVGFLLKDDPDPRKKIYSIFLLTNRHVFNGAEELWFRFDKKEEAQTASFPIQLMDNGQILWLAHKDPSVDLAMVAIAPKFLDDNKINWGFIREDDIAYPENFKEIGIDLGDSVFLGGFPMGLSGISQNNAIVRAGIIARIDEEQISSEKSFLIDATVLPGNSGGPVFLKPESNFLNGTKAVNNSYLIGVVSGYRTYKEPLYSHQTNPPTVAAISVENSGLASIVPINFAKDIYKDFIATKKGLEKKIVGEDKIVGDKTEATLH